MKKSKVNRSACGLYGVREGPMEVRAKSELESHIRRGDQDLTGQSTKGWQRRHLRTREKERGKKCLHRRGIKVYKTRHKTSLRLMRLSGWNLWCGQSIYKGLTLGIFQGRTMKEGEYGRKQSGEILPLESHEGTGGSL